MAKKPYDVLSPDGDEGPLRGIWTPGGEFDSAKAALIAAETENWPASQRAALLSSLRAAQVRAIVKTRYKNPAEIARAVTPPVLVNGKLYPGYVITAAIQLIASLIEIVLTSPRKINLLITMPPQEGKSSMAAVWSVIRALQLNPNLSIILATYAQGLAEAHSRTARDIINTYGAGVVDKLTGLAVEDQIGLKLARGANKVSEWSVEGGLGGLVAAGIGATITGRKADLFIIDDPFKNAVEADSATHREKVHTWFSTVALTRLSPSASVILIQTRWHPEDLAGKILAGERLLPDEERTWRHVNIPAIAEDGIPDALNRPAGQQMDSARDTPEAKRNFALTRKQVGERAWYALYQGSPRNPAGGIFQKAWFDPHLPVPPQWPVASVVGVDPADSGEGDEAGVIAGMLMSDGRVALTHDRSGQYTSDQWAKVAVNLALELGAREIAVEGYTTATTYKQVVRRAYTAIHLEAVGKMTRNEPLTPIEQRAIPDIPPFMISAWRGPSKADAVARSGALSQALETGKCRTVEFALSVFEEQAADWQAGQHQPDRVAAAVIVYDKLAVLAGGSVFTDPTKPPDDTPPDWMRRRIG